MRFLSTIEARLKAARLSAYRLPTEKNERRSLVKCEHLRNKDVVELRQLELALRSRMSIERFVPAELRDLYEVHEWRNGLAVLTAACPEEWVDIQAALREFRLYASEIIRPGGNRSRIAIRLDSLLANRGWRKKEFDTKVVVDQVERSSPTHEIDMFKGGVAFETEWNNKDPFYDRDLNNFRLLFDLRVIQVGVVVTRCDELQDLAVELGRNRQSYGASTTHMSKLLPRLEGGGGGGCPVIVFGIRRSAFIDDRDVPVGNVPVDPTLIATDDD